MLLDGQGLLAPKPSGRLRERVRSALHRIFASRAILAIAVLTLMVLAMEAGLRTALVLQASLLAWRHDGRGTQQVAIPVLEKDWTRYDPLLGWSNLENAGTDQVHINAQGFRADRNFPISKSAELWRLIALGDSFTFGPDVPQGTDYPSVLDRALQRFGEAINLGVCGYGLDQMLLRLERDGLPLRPNVILVGLIMSDLGRADMASWPSGYSKPRFISASGQLVLTNVPPPRPVSTDQRLSAPSFGSVQLIQSFLRLTPMLPGWLAGRVRWKLAERPLMGLQPFSPMHEALLERLKDDADKAGARILIVLLAWGHDLLEEPPGKKDMLAACRRMGLPVLDLYELFRSRSDLLPANGHPTAKGHYAIANAVLFELGRRGWLPGGAHRRLPSYRERRRLRLIDIFLEQAGTAIRAGNRRLALRLLAQAEGLKPSDEAMRRIAESYWKLKQYRQALKVYELRIKGAQTNAELWLDQADVAIQVGNRQSARRFLAQAEKSKPSGNQLKQIAGSYRKLKDYHQALKIYEVLAKRGPSNAELSLEQADIAIQAGNRRLALGFLAQAKEFKASDEEMRRIAESYRNLKQYHQALDVYDLLAQLQPTNVGSWTDQADAAIMAGERGQALSALARAEGLQPARDERHRIALLYQELRVYPRALGILEGLTRRYPDAAVYFSDTGLCRYLGGSAEEAIRDLKRSIELDPKLLSAYITLGSIYTSVHQPEAALSVYNRALKVSSSRDARGGLRKIILQSRRELVSKVGPNGHVDRAKAPDVP